MTLQTVKNIHYHFNMTMTTSKFIPIFTNFDIFQKLLKITCKAIHITYNEKCTAKM